MVDIYTKLPINKSSAMVVDQSGCTSHNGLNGQQERAVLIARFKFLSKRVKQIKKASTNIKSKNDKEYYNIGIEMHEIQEKLSKFNKHEKAARGKRNVGDYIIEILRSKYTKAQWKIILKQAYKLKDEVDNEKM